MYFSTLEKNSNVLSFHLLLKHSLALIQFPVSKFLTRPSLQKHPGSHSSEQFLTIRETIDTQVASHDDPHDLYTSSILVQTALRIKIDQVFYIEKCSKKFKISYNVSSKWLITFMQS